MPPGRAAAAEGIRAQLPRGWEFEAIAARSGTFRGLRASNNLDRWSVDGGPGLVAYWIDATRVGVPSDYYYYAARGPALESLADADGCRPHWRKVWIGRGGDHEVRDAGSFVATASGVCRAPGPATRWAAFVAAPGFGPVRAMGIPESGMYRVYAAVREGPGAGRRISRLVSGVSFGGTSVGEFLDAVSATGGWTRRTVS
ncbi:MAG TPA: hypothetical protein VHL78_05710 [Actinomycetota bacterium]|nr:hypothetical protein [Actinomycetota bacterium]